MAYTFPAAGAIEASGPGTNATKKTAFEDWLRATKQLPGAQDEDALVIASGSVTPTTKGQFTVDTEGSAATDTLTNILQTNLEAGRVIAIRCADSSRVVTVQHGAGGAGQILLVDELDLVLDDPDEFLFLRRLSTDWIEVGRTHRNRLRRIISTTAARTLKASENEAICDNSGATAQVVFTLPTAATGLSYAFAVRDADGVRVQAAAGDTIRILGSVSPAAGYVEAADIGDNLTIYAPDASGWIAIGGNFSDWTVSS